MDYEWDIFVSYRRDAVVAPWVRRVFAPTLQEWLPHSGVLQPRVFRDETSIDAGEAWPDALKRAHGRSKLLVPVLSPNFFESAWCVSELRSMLERETVTGARLVYPIQFSDGDFYPAWAQALQYTKFEEHNTIRTPSQRRARFFEALKLVCGELQARLQAVPAWREDFPRVEVAPAGAVPVRRVAL